MARGCIIRSARRHALAQRRSSPQGAGLYASSSRQRINTKSSTEAELVAVSDAYGQVIWTHNFVAALGQIVGPVQLQRTTCPPWLCSGTAEATAGLADIRYFFMSDRMAAGEVVVAYLPTEQMIADILTKALVGPSSSRPGPS
jgi:hypothetical protein